MDIQTAALFLLGLRVVSSAFIIRVLMYQIPKLRTPDSNNSELYLRYALFLSAIAILVGNIIPIGIDIATIVKDLERSSTILNGTGVIYSFNNAIENVVSAFALWLVYYIIDKEK